MNWPPIRQPCVAGYGRSRRAGRRAPFVVESVWRRPGSSAPRAGQPLIGLMLNGAQGDDDEAHGGHFALMTGRIGVQGGIDDWLVNNFYTLDAESEKGIIAAPVPLDNYLGDLNSGQAWYRPSYLLVATLKDARSAAHLQSALGRVYNQFYRHQFAYQHARANCAGISVTTARTLGWQVPARGPESWLQAIAGLPLVAAREGSLTKGKATFDYLTEDQTRLYPAAAFEEMGADLLRLATGQAGRPSERIRAGAGRGHRGNPARPRAAVSVQPGLGRLAGRIQRRIHGAGAEEPGRAEDHPGAAAQVSRRIARSALAARAVAAFRLCGGGLGAGDCCAIRVHPAPALGIIRLCLPTSSAACCMPSRS